MPFSTAMIWLRRATSILRPRTGAAIASGRYTVAPPPDRRLLSFPRGEDVAEKGTLLDRVVECHVTVRGVVEPFPRHGALGHGTVLATEYGHRVRLDVQRGMGERARPGEADQVPVHEHEVE